MFNFGGKAGERTGMWIEVDAQRSEQLEQRYRAEDALMQAVRRGQTEEALAAGRSLLRFFPGSDTRTARRSTKNELLAVNVLLRKSIEYSGVHPGYIEQLFRRNEDEIECLAVCEAGRPLLLQMIAEYCACVGRYSLRNYSPLVQKTVTYIHLHLEAPLTLRALAELFNVNSSYLSDLFKREAGVTLTEYVTAQRIRQAELLLETTDEPIFRVAERVGMLDVNYFTRLFKKATGLPPTQYRRQNGRGPEAESAPAAGL